MLFTPRQHLPSSFPVIGGRQSTTGSISSDPALGEEASTLLVLVLVVNALGSLTGVGGVADRAGFPVGVLVEFALEV
jgi:hypothetical protein